MDVPNNYGLTSRCGGVRRGTQTLPRAHKRKDYSGVFDVDDDRSFGVNPFVSRSRTNEVDTRNLVTAVLVDLWTTFTC